MKNIGSIISAIGGQIVGAICLVALVVATVSSNPWLYHPIFFLLLCCTGIGCLVFSVTGRETNRKSTAGELFNQAGTIGFLLAGVLLLTVYVWAVIAKI